MTRSRIFASGTYDDPVILSDTEEEPVGSQELTLKKGGYCHKPTLDPPENPTSSTRSRSCQGSSIVLACLTASKTTSSNNRTIPAPCCQLTNKLTSDFQSFPLSSIEFP